MEEYNSPFDQARWKKERQIRLWAFTVFGALSAAALVVGSFLYVDYRGPAHFDIFFYTMPFAILLCGASYLNYRYIERMDGVAKKQADKDREIRRKAGPVNRENRRAEIDAFFRKLHEDRLNDFALGQVEWDGWKGIADYRQRISDWHFKIGSYVDAEELVIPDEYFPEFDPVAWERSRKVWYYAYFGVNAIWAGLFAIAPVGLFVLLGFEAWPLALMFGALGIFFAWASNGARKRALWMAEVAEEQRKLKDAR